MFSQIRIFRYEQDFLVHHADAVRNGFSRLAKMNGLVTVDDLARVARRQPVQNFHKRALARAVFSDNRVDFTLPESNGYLIKGYHAGRVDLDDIVHNDKVFHTETLRKCLEYDCIHRYL